jgi:glycosyltransferase involved in cell wall biosynthesis
MNRPEISIVVPCLDEQENVVPLESAIKAELAKADVQSFEILFIDNGSTDGTIELVKGLCAADASVKLIVNNRNYGQKRSPAHGIYQASGAAVIGMCADFQDPPGMIPEFIARWRGGAKIVLAQRISEKMSLGMRIFRFLGYGFLRRFNDYPVLPNVTGFGLYDREVVDCLKRWRDPEPFFRGMLVESGFSLETIPFHRPERQAGNSKNSFFAIVDFGLSGVASGSSRLLRIPLYLAIFVLAAAGATLAAGFVMLLVGRGSWAPFLLALAAAGFGVILLFLGLIGEQVSVIAKTVRDTPLVVEKERINFVKFDQ